MILRAYLPKILTALFGGLFVALGIVTFGNEKIFDLLLIVTLIFTGILCRKNYNVLSIVVILLCQLMWESLAWKYQSTGNIQKIFLYIAVFCAIYYFRFDNIVRFVAVTVTLVIFAEFYWFAIDYSAPKIYWHIWIMLSSIVVRYLIFSRISFLNQYFSFTGKSINLDWTIYKLTACIVFIQAAMILEYFARHVFGQKDALFVYYSYEYLIHIVGTITIWSIFNESYKQLLPNLLKA